MRIFFYIMFLCCSSFPDLSASINSIEKLHESILTKFSRVKLLRGHSFDYSNHTAEIDKAKNGPYIWKCGTRIPVSPSMKKMMPETIESIEKCSSKALVTVYDNLTTIINDEVDEQIKNDKLEYEKNLRQKNIEKSLTEINKIYEDTYVYIDKCAEALMCIVAFLCENGEKPSFDNEIQLHPSSLVDRIVFEPTRREEIRQNFEYMIRHANYAPQVVDTFKPNTPIHSGPNDKESKGDCNTPTLRNNLKCQTEITTDMFEKTQLDKNRKDKLQIDKKRSKIPLSKDTTSRNVLEIKDENPKKHPDSCIATSKPNYVQNVNALVSTDPIPLNGDHHKGNGSNMSPHNTEINDRGSESDTNIKLPKKNVCLSGNDAICEFILLKEKINKVIAKCKNELLKQILTDLHSVIILCSEIFHETDEQRKEEVKACITKLLDGTHNLSSELLFILMKRTLSALK